MKKLLALLGVITLASTLAACNIDNTDTTQDLKEGTYLAVDINPSIEFIVNEDGVIESYNLVNEDAEIVAADLDFTGMTYEEALDAYLTAAEEAGYIDANADDNAVYISTSEDDTDSEEPTDEEGTTEEPTDEEGTTEEPADEEGTDEEPTDEEGTDEEEGTEEEGTVEDPLNEDGTLRDEVKDHIRNHFEERGIMGAAFDADLADEYGALAEEYDIGLGRVRLISRAVTLQEDLTFEEAVEMNMGEVMSILRNEHREKMNEFRNEKQEERTEFKNAMKEEMRGRGNNDGDTENDAYEGDVDWDQIEDQVRKNIENSRGNHESRMDDIKDKARGHMGGHGPFSGDDDSTDEEDTPEEDTPEEDTTPEDETTPDEETDDSDTTAFIA